MENAPFRATLAALQVASLCQQKQHQNFALKGAPKTASAETARPAALAESALSKTRAALQTARALKTRHLLQTKPCIWQVWFLQQAP